MSVELDSNWFSKDRGFNKKKACSWYEKVLINLNVHDECIKELKKLNKQLVG